MFTLSLTVCICKYCSQSEHQHVSTFSPSPMGRDVGLLIPVQYGVVLELFRTEYLPRPITIVIWWISDIGDSVMVDFVMFVDACTVGAELCWSILSGFTQQRCIYLCLFIG